MPSLPFADEFLTGSVLTIVLPLATVIVVAFFLVLAVRRVPADTPTTSAALPSPEVVDAAGPGVVGDITLEADVTPVDAPADPPANGS